MGVKVLLNRVRSLEGTLGASQRMAEFVDEFEVYARTGIEAGCLCQMDMPEVILCLRQWIRDGVALRLPKGF